MRRWVSVAVTVTVSAMIAEVGVGARADERLAPPTSNAVLMVGGKISRTTDGVAALFDLAMLEALGTVTMTVSMPGNQAPVVFEGVPATVLLAFVGAGGETMSVRTFDDCRADLAVAELARLGAILAVKRDGAYLDASGSGPIALILGSASVLDEPCHARVASVRVE